jgi:hypothetical protein
MQMCPKLGDKVVNCGAVGGKTTVSDRKNRATQTTFASSIVT